MSVCLCFSRFQQSLGEGLKSVCSGGKLSVVRKAPKWEAFLEMLSASEHLLERGKLYSGACLQLLASSVEATSKS